MSSAPAVTVALPVRNAAATISAALRSVLNQTWSDLEIVVCDDGSNDGTPELVRSIGDPRVRLVCDGEARGLVSRLNQIVRIARGRFLARMDADDLSYPQRLSAQLRHLENSPETDLVGTWLVVFDDDGRVLGRRGIASTHEEICAAPENGFPLAHPTYFGRIGWFRANPYAEWAVRCEDQELLLRTYRGSRFANVPEILFGYREAQLALNKIQLGRRNWTRAMIRHLSAEGEYLRVVKGILGQGGRAALDVLAFRTGLGHRLLRQRARPVGEAEVERFAAVWRTANELV